MPSCSGMTEVFDYSAPFDVLGKPAGGTSAV
jgi:hypothetical protein